MKWIFALMIFVFSVAGATDDIIQARQCQIFVDRVVAYNVQRGGVRALRFYVKLNLNSKVELVGFWNQSKRVDYWHRHDDFGPWQNLPLETYFGAHDYYTFALTISDDNTSFLYEGVFFVRTADGRVYWLNARLTPNENFILDNFAFDSVQKAMGRYYNYEVSPERGVRIPYYNPAGC